MRPAIVIAVLLATISPLCAQQRPPTSDELIRQLEEKIQKQIEEYQRGPKRAFAAPGRPGPFKSYVETCSRQIQQTWKAQFPAAARLAIYGSVRARFEVLPSGELANTVIEESSGQPILDDSFLEIIRLAAPFPPFPPALTRDADVLVVTTRMTFERGRPSPYDAPPPEP